MYMGFIHALKGGEQILVIAFCPQDLLQFVQGIVLNKQFHLKNVVKIGTKPCYVGTAFAFNLNGTLVQKM